MLRTAVALALATTALPALTLSAAAQEAPAVQLTPDQAAMRAHVMFLASDAMQGREAGTDAYNIAAAYVAARFYANGLQPAGDDGSYLQLVPLMTYKAADHGSFVLTRDGEPVTLEFGTDYVPAANPAHETTRVSGELVFVGYGIHAPSEGRDDYAGVDVRGKIVVFLSGAPDTLQSEVRAAAGRDDAKAEVAGTLGAVGAIAIDNPGPRGSRFGGQVAMWQRERTTWADPEGNGDSGSPDAPFLGTLSVNGATKLFAGSDLSFEEMHATLAADSNAPLTATPLPASLAVTLNTAREPFESYNVVGLLPGSDPELAHEVVVLTAHLDHVGVGRADASGDTIYNGAMDNAVGIASLIEEARRFQASGEPPRRSILFVAVTAEEKGLVGSDYFATNFAMPGMRMVANVNLDMPIITYPFEDVIAFGADRSSLGPIVRQAAADAGVVASPDPMPEQSFFVRSDHYRFVQQGVPSVFLWPGAGGPGQAAMEAFLATHYHKPSDEVDQAPGIDWQSGVRFIDVNYQIAREIADGDAAPAWNEGDYFGTLYGPRNAR